jgi:hypothetical protein
MVDIWGEGRRETGNGHLPPIYTKGLKLENMKDRIFQPLKALNMPKFLRLFRFLFLVEN